MHSMCTSTMGPAAQTHPSELEITNQYLHSNLILFSIELIRQPEVVIA